MQFLIISTHRSLEKAWLYVELAQEGFGGINPRAEA